uniref:Ribonuclease X25 n=1 Tax=Schistosoma japonicum TaxID=6182 RepID=C7TQR3_SCHJA|nr:Ribonuclease X25 [Schistosoma japonicum]CAX79878.1 Ribonuclease X25 [Schistosoma japonicum]CAX79884.1 Ribonuclease X25 [Schistosoma japonicum]CAX79889.1 Ribonuclease X25 [Schistosoma japonicum]CAX79903.1 Ribonuclease X25 [Schistosoma japonicum]
MHTLLIGLIVSSLCAMHHAQFWNRFMLDLIWTPSNCSAESKCDPPGGYNNFIIGGLWPVNSMGLTPTCQKKVNFDLSRLALVKDKLLNSWPDYHNKTMSPELWKWNYLKFGPCAVETRLIKNEFTYFLYAWIRWKKIDLLKKLEAKGIKPHDSKLQSKMAFEKALKEAYGFKALVICTENSGGLNSKLLEVIVCFNRTLRFADCPSVLGLTECPSEFIFPPYKSSEQ